MTISTDISYSVFGDGDFPVDETLLDNLTYNERGLAREMMSSGFYQNGLIIYKFLRQDNSINLELLELATTISVKMLEGNSKLDVTLNLRGLEFYNLARGISDSEKQMREERIFILGFVSAIAAEASRNDTLNVAYVKDDTKSTDTNSGEQPTGDK